MSTLEKYIKWMSKQMSYENLTNLTPSSRGNLTSVLVPKWLAEIETDGYAVIPVYHNVKTVPDAVKSMVARRHLEKTFATLYFVHTKDDNGNTFLVISNTKKVFKAQRWDAQTHVRGSE